MRALVPCAGFGTRLGALTESLPKPLLEVGKRPLVEHILRSLAVVGVSQVNINLHHMPEAIPARLGDGSRFGVEIEYMREQRLLGTAGTARRLWLEGKAEGALLINYGDVITDMDLGILIQHHLRTNVWATILVHTRQGSNSEVFTDSKGVVERFEERPLVPSDGPVNVFSGICVLSEQCLANIPSRVPCDLARDVFQELAGTGLINSVRLQGYRCAIDSPERLGQARFAWRHGRYLPAWREELAA